MFKFLVSLLYEPSAEVFQQMISHLSLLNEELMNYFPRVTCCAYITNPFCVDPVSVYIGTGGQEELIHIQSDETAKMNIRHAPL